MSKKVLFIVGSLRECSFNHQMALETEKALAGKAEVSYLDYSAIPLFSQDLEVPTLPAVAAVREAVQAADAIWIFSPVYNFSIPGTVKNLLDWLSRAIDLSDTRGASALQDKIVTVSSVANAGHDQLFAIYKDLLPFIRTQVVGDFTAARVNYSAWADGQLVLEDSVAASLKQQAEDLLRAIQ
jgi:oxidoreductase